MTEYTEHALLVDTLRMCASKDRFCSFLCPYHRKREGYECIWTMMREAADANESQYRQIEELRQEITEKDKEIISLTLERVGYPDEEDEWEERCGL